MDHVYFPFSRLSFLLPLVTRHKNRAESTFFPRKTTWIDPAMNSLFEGKFRLKIQQILTARLPVDAIKPTVYNDL